MRTVDVAYIYLYTNRSCFLCQKNLCGIKYTNNRATLKINNLSIYLSFFVPWQTIQHSNG